LRARADVPIDALLSTLLDEHRAIRIRVAGEARMAAAEDAARYRDALGAAVPSGLPGAFTEPVADPLAELVARFARTHPPFTAGEVAARFGVGVDRVGPALQRLADAGRVVSGEFRPDGMSVEWCDVGVLQRVRRLSLAHLRREIEPVEPAVLARFLPQWQGIGSARHGLEAVVDAVALLQGAVVTASTLEADVLPARVGGFGPAQLDELASTGELVWVGAGPIGSGDGRVVLAFRDRVAALVDAPGGERPDPLDGPVHDAIRDRLARSGASFWLDLVAAAGTAVPEGELLTALWDLVWAGEVTNDTFAALRSYLAGGSRPARGSRRAARPAPGRSRPRPGRISRLGPPAGAGRWSLVEALTTPPPSTTERVHAVALQLLERHGVLTREAVRAEGVPGGFATVYPVLRALEEGGRVRRGYFVAGLGAAQFALPGAVDRLRALRAGGEAPDRPSPALVLAATDPAQPFGAALAWPATRPEAGRPVRAAGAYVVLVDGVPAAYLERGGRNVVTFTEEPDAWIDPLTTLVKDGRVAKLELHRVDGRPVRESKAADALRAAGLRDAYRGLVLRG
jgi:ATP-dependent Lhr-like helicase